MTFEQARQITQLPFRGADGIADSPPPSVRWWRLAKQATLALLLVVAFLAYYLIGVMIEAISLL